MKTTSTPPSSKREVIFHAIALPSDVNVFGDISGGWLISQMETAGSIVAARLTHSRLVVIAIDVATFMVPIQVGSTLSFYADILEIGNSSVKVLVEVWGKYIESPEPMQKIIDNVFTYVALDRNGKTKGIKR